MTRLFVSALGALSLLVLGLASIILAPGCGPLADCSMSFCGCWQPTTLSFSTQVIERDGGFVSGADVQCIGGSLDGGAKPPTATTDAQGRASLSFQTQQSPGCGFQNCNQVRVSRSDGGFSEFPTSSVNGGTAVMPAADAGL